MTDAHELGQDGETLAVNFLETKGYLILDRNVRLRRGEIDIVAREGGDLVFLEVKTRSSNDFGTPEDAITPEKAKKIAMGAQEYIYQNLLTGESLRCDVIAITMPGDTEPVIHLYKRALDLGDFLQE